MDPADVVMLDTMDRRDLAEFLRVRRARVQPGDVGLPNGRRRRTPGLRREEVARLAGMSVDYYTRLEQARGPRPSPQVLEAMARALRLSTRERSHLFHLSGHPAPSAGSPSRMVPPSILSLLDRLDDTPAYVLDAKYDVLAWNALAAALICDFSALPESRRNMFRICGNYTGDPAAYADGTAGNGWNFPREAVADLRAAAARYPNDPQVQALAREVASGPAADLWSAHHVEVRRSVTKRLHHPIVGPLELVRDILLIPDHDQQLVLYTAAPGTPSHDALRLLKVVGVQDLAADACLAEHVAGSRGSAADVTGTG